jgi:hypothetical protein
MVMESRQARTLRLNQSITAARYTKPLAMRMYVMSIVHTWFGRVTGSLRSRHGNILWPGSGFEVLGRR